MKRIWKHKWVVGGVALVIFLSIGTAAWAATGNGGSNPAATGVASANASAARVVAAANGQNSGTDSALGARRAALKERAAQFGKRQQALLNLVRDKMAPADQAKYDQLVQQIKAQKTALQKARTDLQSSVKDLRSLTQKYLSAGAGSAGTTGTNTQ